MGLQNGILAVILRFYIDTTGFKCYNKSGSAVFEKYDFLLYSAVILNKFVAFRTEAMSGYCFFESPFLDYIDIVAWCFCGFAF